MNQPLKYVTILVAAASLQACASMNVFKDNSADQAAMSPPPLQPLAPAPAMALSAAQIKTLMAGKSWSWQGPKNSGVTLYANDGSSLVQVNGKGTTKGTWVAKDGQLCESFAPAPFLPQGVPLSCQAMTGSAGTYKVGQATFTIAS